MRRPHVQIIVGSVRKGRASGPVGRWIAERFEAEFGYPAEIVDLRDWNLGSFDITAPPAMGTYPDRLQRAWAATISRADAFVFIVPEYNHGYTGSLKNALDWVFAEWAHKPAVLVSYGNANGARAIQQLKQVMGELRLVPLEPTLALNPHRDIENRRFNGTPENETRLSRSLAELHRWEGALASLRHPAARPSWAGRRVQVIGLDPKTNRSVVAPLVAAGLDAHGIVLKDGDELPDGNGYELVAIGRGASGDLADAIRKRVGANDPAKAVIEVLGPIAVRQILAACDPASPALNVTSFDYSRNSLTLTVSGDPGRLGVTAYEHSETGLIPHRIATVEMRGKIEMNVSLDVTPYSFVVDIDGAAFWHYPVL